MRSRPTLRAVSGLLGGLALLVPSANAQLLGVNAEAPTIEYNGTGTVDYTVNDNPATPGIDEGRLLRITADPLKFRDALNIEYDIAAPKDVEINIRVLNNAGTNISGVAGDDLIITGQIDINGDGDFNDPEDFSGVLLTGEVTKFGFQDFSGALDFFDFCFRPTGGALIDAGLFLGRDIGVNQRLEFSGFDGDFNSNFSARAKGAAGSTAAKGSGQGLIGNFVWNDVDRDGIQDPNELGLSGVTVILRDDQNQIVSVAITNFQGQYEFPDVGTGTYTVSIDPTTLPDGATPTDSNVGGDDTVDSDGSGVTVVIPNDTTVDLTIDFGYVVPGSASLGDFVWLDANLDGIQDAGESGITNVTVRLFDAGFNLIAVTQTNAMGRYEFLGLIPGTYTVFLDSGTLPPGYVPTAANAGGDIALDSSNSPVTVTLAEDEFNRTIDFGFISPGTGRIGDFIWQDDNGDGIQDPGEPGIQGVIVELLNDSGRVIATAVTGPNGEYQFNGLPAGDYVVRIDPGQGALAGLTPSPIGAGGDTASDSNGTFIPVTLPTDNTTNLTLDSGFVPAGQGQLGNFVWNDLDRDGIQDFDEPGISNVTVELRNPANNTIIATTTTGPMGEYLFTGLNAGDYLVVVVNPPAGFTPTDPNIGVDDTIDSDGPLDGSGVLVNLPTQTSQDLTIDFGYVAPATGRIGNFIWHDQDNDGIQDTNEPGLAGIRVLLRDDQGTVVGDTFTIAGGMYLFEGLTAGTYTVDVVENTLPPGFTITQTDAGADDTIDSDGPQGGGAVTVVLANDDSEDLTIDFGYNSPAEGRIGDFVWNDLDRDGIQDPNEPGIEGVRVELRDPIDMSLIAFTFTDTDGAYEFTGLLAGDYKVQVIPPVDATASPVDQGGDDTVDSDPNGVIVTLPGNQDEDQTIDFGYFFEELGRIGDYVWFDANNNGVQDTGETGISGVTVTLSDGNGTPLATTVTDGAGFYIFENLAAGDYRVDVIESSLSAGFVITSTNTGGNDEIDNDGPQDGGFVAVNLPLNNSEDLTNDFGYIRPANGAIGDRLWDDLDGDGIQDPGEPGLPGVTVTLIDKDTGQTVDTQVTGANGNYLFNDLPAGNYTIQISNLPAGYGQTGDPDGTNDNMTMLTLGVNETNLDQDFGYNRPLGRLGNFVWLDLNGNGIQDNGENGIANATVNLIQGGSIIATDVTDANGAYLFTGLRGGDYQVDVVEASLPAGVQETLQNQGANDAVDSDVNANGDPVSVTLVGDNDQDLTIDFGYIGTGSIGDFIWQDSDGDGQQDVGEPGVPGVTVKLIDANGNTIATTVTDANGGYSFNNLPAGDYTIMINPNTIPEGLQQTFDLDGTLDGMTTITLGAGETRDDLDFGYRPSGAIGNFVWIDANGNGLQDNGEVGIPNVTVNLLQANMVIGTTVTDANGMYLFDGLIAEAYAIDVDESTLPAGVFITLSNVGGNDAIDNDGPQNGGPVPVILGPAQVNLTIDFGYLEAASLGNYVFVDTNGDGLQNDGGTGVPGVTVELLGTNGNVIATTTTDANGFYLFDGLRPGTYTVRFVKPLGFDFTIANVGNDDAIDSDANANTGLAQPVILASGENNLTIDAGLVEEQIGVCPKSLNFDTDASGTPLPAGTIIDDEYSDLGITVSSANPANPVMIFDTNNPTGDDYDLRTPGSGNGNNSALNNVLILSEDGDSNDPDDNGAGGTMIFDFTQPIDIEAVRLLDIDTDETVTIRSFNDTGGLIGTVTSLSPGNNSVHRVPVDADGVSRLEIEFSGSGALAELIYCDELVEEDKLCPDEALSDPRVNSQDSKHALFLPGVATDFQLGDDAMFEQFDDGTARFVGTATSRTDSSKVLFIDVVLSGRTTTPPPGSPKKELFSSAYSENGGPVNTNTWYYYQNFTGTLTGQGALDGAILDIFQRGEAFQVGKGANGKNFRFGGSAWLNFNIRSQPTNGPEISNTGFGDFNIDLMKCPGLACMEATGDNVGGHNGNSNYDAGANKWTINGGGFAWGTHDNLHYVHKTVTGDTQIIARVTSVDGAGGNGSSAGVMIRETLNSGSKVASINWFTNQQGIHMRKRTSNGANTTTAGWRTSVPGPVWMRLTRTGNTFKGEFSKNGSTWITISTFSITMGADVEVGLYTANGNSSYIGMAMFDNVTVDGAALKDDCSVFVPPASVGDRVWLDNNANGQQEPDEPGLAGVVVKLLNGLGQQVGIATTDANGNYLFDNLMPGTYVVMIDPNSVPVELRQSFELDGSTDGMVSVDLVSGDARDDVDFGYFDGMGQCGACAGGVTQIELKNIKPHHLWIDIQQRDANGNLVVTFSARVEAGETFTLNGLMNDGTFGSNFWIYIDGPLVADPKTDCSRNIEIGTTYAGLLQVVGGASKDGGPFCEIMPDKGEVGKVYVQQNDSYQWHTVQLQGTYIDPVVVMNVQSYNSSHPINVRLRNITASSFQFQGDEYDYQNGFHPGETYSYLVFERGEHTLANGAKVKAGTTNMPRGYRPNVWVNFGNTFSTKPVVVSTIASQNDPNGGITRQHSVSASGFRLYEQEEQRSTQFRNGGPVNWIAIEPGSSGASGAQFEVGSTGDNQTHLFRTRNFVQSYNMPLVLAAQQNRDGGDPAAVRMRSLQSNSVQFKVEEEQSYDSEINHTTENIGYFIFQGPRILN